MTHIFEPIPQQEPSTLSVGEQMVQLHKMASTMGLTGVTDLLQGLIEGRNVVSVGDYTPVSRLPEEFVIVEVLYQRGQVSFSWREGADPTLGSAAFDDNHGEVIGWKALSPGQAVDEETLRLHAELMETRKSTKF